MMAPYTYRCSKCGRSLTIEHFHKHPSKKGHYSICRGCRARDDRRIMNNLISNARRRAKKRGLPCTLTRGMILALNERQHGLCVYSGMRLNWQLAPTGKQRICPIDRVSLDRIDSAKGYTPDNIQLVTDFVNRMKGWYSERDFINFCRLIALRRA